MPLLPVCESLVNVYSTVCAFQCTLCPWKSVIVQSRCGASVCKHFLRERWGLGVGGGGGEGPMLTNTVFSHIAH